MKMLLLQQHLQKVSRGGADKQEALRNHVPGGQQQSGQQLSKKQHRRAMPQWLLPLRPIREHKGWR